MPNTRYVKKSLPHQSTSERNKSRFHEKYFKKTDKNCLDFLRLIFEKKTQFSYRSPMLTCCALVCYVFKNKVSTETKQI